MKKVSKPYLCCFNSLLRVIFMSSENDCERKKRSQVLFCCKIICWRLDVSRTTLLVRLNIFFRQSNNKQSFLSLSLSLSFMHHTHTHKHTHTLSLSHALSLCHSRTFSESLKLVSGATMAAIRHLKGTE